MNTEKIIEIKNLDKSFGDVHAVNGLSFCGNGSSRLALRSLIGY